MPKASHFEQFESTGVKYDNNFFKFQLKDTKTTQKMNFLSQSSFVFSIFLQIRDLVLQVSAQICQHKTFLVQQAFPFCMNL